MKERRKLVRWHLYVLVTVLGVCDKLRLQLSLRHPRRIQFTPISKIVHTKYTTYFLLFNKLSAFLTQLKRSYILDPNTHNIMRIEIIPVQNDAQLKEFINFPGTHYKNDPHWVAPLLIEEKKEFDAKRNPFYQHADVQLFLALRDNRIAGRISAQVDRNHIEFHNEKVGFFGFFETIEDEEVALGLLNAATDWIKDQGMERVQGPFSYNTNGISGMLIDPFDQQPRMMMPYNPSYYPKFVESAGFSKVKDLVAMDAQLDENYKEQMENELLPKMDRMARRAVEHGYTIRNANMKDFDNELKRLWEIYNEAWEKNWGFVPMTAAEFFNQAEQLKQIVIPELAVIVEDGDEPVGFGLALPDIYQAMKPLNGKLFPFGVFKLLSGIKKIDTLRLLTLGFKKSVRKRGVDAMLYSRMIKAAIQMPRFKLVECSWMLEDNILMIRIIERIGGKITRTYRVFEKSLV